MPESVVTYIYKNTQIEGESLQNWMQQWKTLSPEDQQNLRDYAAAEMALNR